MKIDDLKALLNKKTSEEIFGIDPQPVESCPMIDAAIKDHNRMVKDVRNYCSDLLSIDNTDQAAGISKNIKWYVSGIETESSLEDLRMQCVNIRSWGQGWKNLAKQLIEMLPEDQLWRILSDEDYLKIKDSEEPVDEHGLSPSDYYTGITYPNG